MMTYAHFLKLREGYGPYIGPCVDTDNYQVQGACSQLNTDKENAKISKGEYKHKKVKKFRSLKEITEETALAPVSPMMSSQPQKSPTIQSVTDTEKKKWSASKKDILNY